jgi:hypothetical protein
MALEVRAVEVIHKTSNSDSPVFKSLTVIKAQHVLVMVNVLKW